MLLHCCQCMQLSQRILTAASALTDMLATAGGRTHPGWQGGAAAGAGAIPGRACRSGGAPDAECSNAALHATGAAAACAPHRAAGVPTGPKMNQDDLQKQRVQVQSC